MKQNKCHFQALYQMAEMYYQATEFENSLVFYHRGKTKRPALNKFVLGIKKAEAAIASVIGGTFAF